jgi:hypothetical protein
MQIRPRRALVSLALATLSVLPLTGCNPYKQGGSGQSADTYTYISDAFAPKTVSLVDTRTGETIWSYEVPVGHQLTIRFYSKPGSPDPNNPDIMRWEEFATKNTYGVLRNVINVPPATARRLDFTLRATPETKPVGS